MPHIETLAPKRSSTHIEKVLPTYLGDYTFLIEKLTDGSYRVVDREGLVVFTEPDPNRAERAIQYAMDNLPSPKIGLIKLTEGIFYLSDSIIIDHTVKLHGIGGVIAYDHVGLNSTTLCWMVDDATKPAIIIRASDDTPVAMPVTGYPDARAVEGVELCDFGMLPIKAITGEVQATNRAILFDGTSEVYTKGSIVRFVLLRNLAFEIFDEMAIETRGGVYLVQGENLMARCKKGLLHNTAPATRTTIGGQHTIIGIMESACDDGEWNIRLETSGNSIIGGKLGGGNGISAIGTDILGTYVEGRGSAGSIGIEAAGVEGGKIFPQKVVSHEYEIVFPADVTAMNFQISTYTRPISGGYGLWVQSGGAKMNNIVYFLGDGDILNDHYPRALIDFRNLSFGMASFPKVRYHYPADPGSPPRMWYDSYSLTLLADNKYSWIPIGVQSGTMARHYDDFEGVALSAKWSITGTVTIQNIRHGVVRLTTAATAGSSASLSYGGNKHVYVYPYAHTGGMAIKFKLLQTTGIKVLIVVYRDTDNYFGLLADPAVSTNFQLIVRSAAVDTLYDTEVALDTEWHTVALEWFWGQFTGRFDGVAKATRVSQPAGDSEPYIYVETAEAVSKDLDIDYIDLWWQRP